MQGINIFSGESGLGGALTNPTALARRKGNIEHRYPIKVNGVAYQDVELAYHAFKTGDAASDNDMMANLIAQKLLDHPSLMAEVTERGGLPFLEVCSHITYARSSGGQAWEGYGRDSRFIRNMMSGYEIALSGTARHFGQTSLF